MKKLIIALLCFTFLVSFASCGGKTQDEGVPEADDTPAPTASLESNPSVVPEEPSEPEPEVYTCFFNEEDTGLNNGYNAGLISALSRRYTFTQQNTLTLLDHGYVLTKCLTTETGSEDPGIRISYTFEGVVERDGDRCVLRAPASASANQDWGSVAKSYASVIEEGSFTSDERPGLLWNFTSPWLTDRCIWADVSVTLSDDGSFLYDNVESAAYISMDGNAAEYAVASTPELEDRPLEGKVIYWLGSSVTFGSASGEESMVEYIAKRQNCTCVKDAVSGTTLFGDPFDGKNTSSYVARLVNSTVFDRNSHVDAFVCQISTNDVTKPANALKLGVITADDKRSLEDFDCETTLGAVEYIICYVQQVWDCPVVFYAGTWFGGESGYHYATLIEEIKKLESKWGITVLDLFNDPEMNSIDAETYANYMSDSIHPRKIGYLRWWTPKFEEHLKDLFD